MEEKLSLYIEALDPSDHLERDYYRQILKDSSNGIELCKDPESADRIMITDIFNYSQFDQIPEHPLLKQYPKKTLIITESDQPIEIWPGLYTSGLRRHIDKPTIHGWYYPYFRVRFPNPTLVTYKETQPAEKKFLASFVGYPSHIFRDKLAKYWAKAPDMHISVSRVYHHFAEDDKAAAEKAQKDYLDTIRASRFSLCPRGRGPSSIRLFESMQLGVAPVIISDNWLPPSFIDWESCSLIVKENDIKDLRKILEERLDESEELGKNAQHIFKEYFTPENIGKSMNLALNNLAESMEEKSQLSPSFVRSTRRHRKSKFKFDYYKALLHNALAKVSLR